MSIQVFDGTAFRSSIMRFRDAPPGRDTWVQGIGTFVLRNGQWRELRHQSTLLHQADTAEPQPVRAFTGNYRIRGRGNLRVVPAGDILLLQWESGVRLPIVPLGGDRFGAGPNTIVTFLRDRCGQVVSATRAGGQGALWSADRLDVRSCRD